VAGVEALGRALQIDTRIDTATLAWRVNDELPADISILELERAPQRFHARHDAVARSYLYQVARRRTAFAKPYVWWVREDLHVKAMREAAAAFVGLQDFRGFSANDPEETSSKVQVDRVEIIEEPPLLLIRVVGSHFLWRMVRRMVGVLVAVGRRELKPADVPRMLVEASSESAALAAPASGLFLERVYYPGDDREDDPCRPRGQSGTRSGPSGCGVPPSANS
jgi:tRNA pseudouridine38-40 synthase